MGSTLGPQAVREVAEIVRRVLGEVQNPGGERARYTGPPPSLGLILAKTTTTHSHGATKPVQRYKGSPSTEVTVGSPVDAYNYFADLTSGHWCIIAPINGTYLLVMADPCST